MTQIKESTGKTRFLHWVQVAVMFLSFGFIFPHAMTEDTDFAKENTPKNAALKKR